MNTTLTARPTAPTAAPQPDVPRVAPSERYLFSVAAGQWKGTLDFRVTSWRGWARADATLREKLLAAGLHAVCRLPGRVGVCAHIDAQPGRGVAHNRTYFQHEGFFLAAPVSLARMEGMFRVTGPDSLALSTRNGDGLGLFPVSDAAEGVGRVDPDGNGARYELPVFGSGWNGTYRARATVQPGDTVEVRYTHPQQGWGELNYRAQRVEAPTPRTPSPSVALAQERMRALGRRLEAHACALRRAGSLLAGFTDVYALESFDIADALDGRFQDPAWVAEVGATFGERYLAALEGHLHGGWVPRHWKLVFDACAPERAGELDALVSGILAHIAGDLAETLAEVGALQEHVADFTTVDRIVEEGVDRVLREFAHRYNPAYDVWNRLAGQPHRRVVLPWVTALRRSAFFQAVRIQAGGAERDAAREEIARGIERVVSEVHYPESGLVRRVARSLRRWTAGAWRAR